jgi:2-phosphosulfolactate phosphatase
MPCNIEVLFTPADFEALGRRDLSRSTCVVFDVFRATSVIVTALAHGAAAVIPVKEISEALDRRRQYSDALLGGERGGLKIDAEQTGGVDFDLGNSPREYTREKVAGKTIIATTTNGTRALLACAGAQTMVAASFLNINAAADFVLRRKPDDLWLVCAGTGVGAALEDVLAAGALCDLVMAGLKSCETRDSAHVALRAYRQSSNDLQGAVHSSCNARRLLANPGLREDVDFCLRRDYCSVVPILEEDGRIRKTD